MLRKYIIRLALSAALVLGGAAGARADDLVIDGLGKIPLGNAVTVQNGNGTDIQNFLKKGAERKGYGKTSNAAMWTLMTVPPGMNVYPEKPPTRMKAWSFTSSGSGMSAASIRQSSSSFPERLRYFSMKETGELRNSGVMPSAKMPSVLRHSLVCLRSS